MTSFPIFILIVFFLPALATWAMVAHTPRHLAIYDLLAGTKAVHDAAQPAEELGPESSLENPDHESR